MREIRVYAPAKLNLYLDVLDKRSDSFHNIETLFEKIDLKDEIIIRETDKKGISVRAYPDVCKQGRENIAYKAAQAICKEAGVRLNLDIRIKKKIPVSAGLGGGSSDAASCLRAINKAFRLGISDKRLFSIATTIGKDVPFFMLEEPFAVGRLRGELLKPIKTSASFFHILIKPNISISTAKMYERIDRHNYSNKKHSLQNLLYALKRKEITMLEKSYYNIFENVLAKDSFHINKIKGLLLRAGAPNSLLSGSGPTVFCTFKNKKSAEETLQRIPKQNDADIFLVNTYRGSIWR